MVVSCQCVTSFPPRTVPIGPSCLGSKLLLVHGLKRDHSIRNPTSFNQLPLFLHNMFYRLELSVRRPSVLKPPQVVCDEVPTR